MGLKMDIKDKVIATLALLVILGISHGVVAWKAYNVGVEMNEASHALKTASADDHKIDIKGKQDAVINNPPTEQRVINRMLGHTF